MWACCCQIFKFCVISRQDTITATTNQVRSMLPTHGGTKRNNGISGMPMVDKGVALSLLWILLSLGIMYGGFAHCRSNAYKYSMTCKDGQCTWQASDDNILQYSTKYINDDKNPLVYKMTFPKYDLLDSEMVRIDSNGEFADSAKMRVNKKERFGYSIRMRVRQPPEPESRLKIEKNHIFIPYDLGRRTARSGSKSINDFIEDSEAKTFSYSRSKNITVVGILSIVAGFVSLICAVVFGRWSEQPRRVKKSS